MEASVAIGIDVVWSWFEARLWEDPLASFVSALQVLEGLARSGTVRIFDVHRVVQLLRFKLTAFTKQEFHCTTNDQPHGFSQYFIRGAQVCLCRAPEGRRAQVLGQGWRHSDTKRLR